MLGHQKCAWQGDWCPQIPSMQSRELVWAVGISAPSSIHCPMHTVWTVSSRWRSTAMCSCPLMVVSTGCRLPSSAPPAPSLSPTSPSIGRTAPSSSSETIDGVRGASGCFRMGLGGGGRAASEAPQGWVAWTHHLCLLRW